MLERMMKTKRGHMKAGKSIHKFKVGDLVHKKHAQEKLDLKWEPNYGIIRLPTAWTAVIEHTVSGRTRRFNGWGSTEETPA